MLDAACLGEVFTSPMPDQMMAAAEAVDSGASVQFIVKNYAGDVMNYEMGAEMSSGDTAMVLTNDELPSKVPHIHRVAVLWPVLLLSKRFWARRRKTV